MKSSNMKAALLKRGEGTGCGWERSRIAGC